MDKKGHPGNPDGLAMRGRPRPLFHVFVEPAEEFAVPDERVLGPEDLVRLVFEFHQPRRDATHAGGREGFERLRVGDPEIVFTREDQDRSIPFVDEFVRRIGVGALCDLVRPIPVGASVVVVDEEQFFGLTVHRLEVEDAAVGDERLETLSWQPARKNTE